MEKNRNKLGFGSMFLMGVLLLLMIAVFSTQIYAQGSALARRNTTSENAISMLDPFLLQKVTIVNPVIVTPPHWIEKLRLRQAYYEKYQKEKIIIPDRPKWRSKWCPLVVPKVVEN